MSIDLNGRTALVTGSTSGIGEATALALAARGAHVLIVGRDAALLQVESHLLRQDELLADLIRENGTAVMREGTQAGAAPS